MQCEREEDYEYCGKTQEKFLKILQMQDTPIAARELAGRFGVSRQVIVQDLAVIRASTPGILSTTKGYVIQQDSVLQENSRFVTVRRKQRLS